MDATKVNEEIKSMHIAVYALSLLSGTHTKVHTEDIAHKCMEVYFLCH